MYTIIVIQLPTSTRLYVDIHTHSGQKQTVGAVCLAAGPLNRFQTSKHGQKIPSPNKMLKKIMSPDSNITLINCIICLDDKFIYAWCNYCYSCRICLSCYTDLCCANKQECCPCCRKNIWFTETRPETHPQLTPQHNQNALSININILQLNHFILLLLLDAVLVIE